MTPGSYKSGKLADQTPEQEMILRYSAIALLYTVFMIAVFAGWLNVPGGKLSALWALAPVFVWSIRAPEFLPAWLLFVIGVLSDIVLGTPLGAHGLALLFVAIITRLQQRYLAQQGFVPVWLDFAALSFVSTALIAVITVIGQAKEAAWLPIFTASFMSWVVLTLAFPLLSLAAHALLNLVRRFER